MLIDTHAHLYWDSYKDDLNQIIQRSLEAGVTTIVNVGVDVEKSQEALRQTQKELTNSPGFSAYSTIGIHPHEAVKYNSNVSIHQDMQELEQIYLSDTTRVVAVGECGLDYLFDPEFTPTSLSIKQIKDLQKKLFHAQIELAKKLKLPLIVHSRDDRSKDSENSECWNEVIDMTKDHFGIYHCYSGLPQTTNHILQTTDFLIAFAANITYPKNEYLREAAKLIPLNRIVLETDSPFLSPQSRRGRRNEPSSVKEIAELIADLKGLSLEEVAEQTTANAKKVFNL